MSKNEEAKTETAAEWLRAAVAEGLNEMLDDVAREEGRAITDQARAASQEVMRAGLAKLWPTTEADARAMRRDFTTEQIKAAVRLMYEPQYRRAREARRTYRDH